MSATANQASNKRRLLLASDRMDQSGELAEILRSVGDVDTVATSDIPAAPKDLSGVVVDINLRSMESVQAVRKKLQSDAYMQMPRLFVLEVHVGGHTGMMIDPIRWVGARGFEI